jgi:hypothetical protein
MCSLFLFLSIVSAASCYVRIYHWDEFLKRSRNFVQNSKFLFHYVTKDPKDLKNMYLNNITTKGKVSLIEFKPGNFVALLINDATKMASLRYEIYLYFENEALINITPPPGYSYSFSPADFGAEKIFIVKDTTTTIVTKYKNEKITFPPAEAYQEEILDD